MPDLHKDAVHAFWDSYDRKTLYRVICALERVESWVLDSEPDIEPAIMELGRVIDSVTDFNLAGNEDAVIRVLASTCSSRTMRIMQSLDLAKPNTAADLLIYAEDHAAGDTTPANAHIKMFLQRNMVFEKLQLLSRVFSTQRISLVIKALERYNG